MPTTRILIDNQTMDLPKETEVLLDFQACDVTRPDTIQSGYSNVFELPDSKRNRRVAKGIESLSSQTDVPYTFLDARVEVSGVEIIPNGKAMLEDGYQPGRIQPWQIFSGNIDLPEALGDKTLKDLDFSQFEHVFNPTNVVGSRTNGFSQGYVYSMINRGKAGQSAQYRWFDLYPSVFVRAIWDQIFKEAGFTYRWAREENNLFDQLILPCANPPKLSDKYVDARRAYVNAKNWRLRNGTPANNSDVYVTRQGTYTVAYNNDTTDGFLQGSNKLFNTSTHEYKADATYFVDVYAFFPLTNFNVSFGRVAVGLDLYKNGQVVASVEVEKTGVSLNTNVILELNVERLLLNANDRLQVKLKVQRRTGTAAYDVVCSDSDSIVLDITVRKDFPPNATVKLQEFLPDIKQWDFIKSHVFLFCLLLQTDSYGKKINIVPFDNLEQNLPKALDWSAYVDDRELEVAFAFGSFGQKSWIKWLPLSNANPNKYSGYLTIQNKKLDSEVDIIQLPYSITENRFGLPFIENFIVSESQPANATEIVYEEVEATPRLLVHQMKESNLKYLNDNGTEISAPGPRPIPRFLPDLDIQTKVIPERYRIYQRMLNGTRFVKVDAVLPVTEVANLDHSVPIYLNTNRIGGEYFYLNAVREWAERMICILELVRL